MSFLRNCWYVAAWASELQSGRLLGRRILNEPVLLFRKQDGIAVALQDRCPHRFAPLHLGKITQDGVQCPYHGLRFDAQGHCVHNPHGATPASARVRAYPIVERYSAIWIWMGDPGKADPDLVVPLEFLVPETSFVGDGYLPINAHYELETDNILDLSHIEFLHPLFASDAVRAARVEFAQEGEAVWCKRFIANDSPPDFIRSGFGIPPDSLVDRWLDVCWHAPAIMALYIGGVASGNPPETGRLLKQAHIFTPETEQTTHYFYATSFPRAMGDAGERMARDSVQVLRGPFEQEDKPIVEAIARNMDGMQFWDLKPMLLSVDGAAVMARRILQKKIRAEEDSALHP